MHHKNIRNGHREAIIGSPSSELSSPCVLDHDADEGGFDNSVVDDFVGFEVINQSLKYLHHGDVSHEDC